MNIRFLEDGESPDIGAYKKGDERIIPADIAHIFIARGMAEEIKRGTVPDLRPPRKIIGDVESGLSPQSKINKEVKGNE